MTLRLFSLGASAHLLQPECADDLARLRRITTQAGFYSHEAPFHLSTVTGILLFVPLYFGALLSLFALIEFLFFGGFDLINILSILFTFALGGLGIAPIMVSRLLAGFRKRSMRRAMQSYLVRLSVDDEPLKLLLSTLAESLDYGIVFTFERDLDFFSTEVRAGTDVSGALRSWAERFDSTELREIAEAFATEDPTISLFDLRRRIVRAAVVVPLK